ncbi:MAG: CRISPR-associated protein Cas4 [Crenarchaeota archaeon]|nr:CRISPR-associated protein Cas4 [Thermoproteota archaeon]
MYVSVTDIKNYVYCPYIVYIRRVLNLDIEPTEYMLYGKEIEKETILLSIYRTIRGTEIIRSLTLRSSRLRLIGSVEYVIVDKYGQHVPVDIKWCESEDPRRDHKVQICAYGMLIEDNLNTKCKMGILYYVGRDRGRLHKVFLTRSLRNMVVRIVEEILKMLKSSQPPEHVPREDRCRTCPYARVCNFKHM